ncbi:hypothetical protein [Kovacikia minuta]|uniref:hypothetical protein n=1 Tax=Kovacikia minuta TaxID=2931930 RepID=UPI0020C7FBD4
MKTFASVNRFGLSKAVILGVITLTTGILTAACQESAPPSNTQSGTSPAPTSPTAGDAKGLKISSLLPATGDLASIGQPMLDAVPPAS